MQPCQNPQPIEEVRASTLRLPILAQLRGSVISDILSRQDGEGVLR
jgi:hypothetical protein